MGVKLASGEVLSADAYILATGGSSRPETGSTGDGFKWLAKLGHSVRVPEPSLVPITEERQMSQALPTIGHWIDGKNVVGEHRSQEVWNPATGVAEKRVLLADKATVEAAIASAEAAFPAWRATAPLKRARVMSKLKNLLEMHAEKVAAVLTALRP